VAKKQTSVSEEQPQATAAEEGLSTDAQFSTYEVDPASADESPPAGVSVVQTLGVGHT
jgi:hypothetical protein